MNNQSAGRPATLSIELSDGDIRDYAYHLFQQGNCVPGHDLDNWLEAIECLKAKIPSNRSGTRLHEYVNSHESGEFPLLSIEARILAS
jgi:Cu/Zn superoxide dismutase